MTSHLSDAITEKTRKNKHERGCRERGTLVQFVGTPTGVATLENRLEVPQKKIKNITTIQSSNSISGYLSKENKNNNSKGQKLPYVYRSIGYNSQDMGTTKVSVDRWTDEEGMACTRWNIT